MAEAPEEAAEISARADALYLNMGCLTRSRLEAMHRAGRAARAAGLPVVLDPVGAGLSAFRRRALDGLTEALRPLLLKGNLSELRFWARPERGGGAIDSALRALSPGEQAELRRGAARRLPTRQRSERLRLLTPGREPEARQRPPHPGRLQRQRLPAGRPGDGLPGRGGGGRAARRRPGRGGGAGHRRRAHRAGGGRRRITGGRPGPAPARPHASPGPARRRALPARRGRHRRGAKM